MSRVSVIMVVHNGESYLRDSIESVLNQTFTDFEFLIIDDGSTDGSLNIIKTYNDPRIRLIQNDTNLGLIAVRNKGLDNAEGEYIAWLDCDDIAYPTRLAEQVGFMERHSDFGMIGSWFEAIDEHGVPTGKIWKFRAPSDKIPVILLFHNYFAQSSVLIRKSVLGDDRYRLYPGAEDYDLWVRIARKAKVWNLPKVLMKYRVHQKNITHTNAGIIEQYVRKIVANQIEFLGLYTTSGDLETHRRIACGSFEPSPHFLSLAEDWLKKLLYKNRSSICYDENVFEEYIGERWYKLCLSSTQLGMRMWQVYRRSSLSKLVKYKTLRVVYLTIKCFPTCFCSP